VKDPGRWERAFLIVSLLFFAAGLVLSLRTGEELDWGRARLFLPSGLLALSAANVRLRSKLLSWGLFSLSFVLFMAVMGPWVVGLRIAGGVETLKFMRAMALYLSLALTGLFQLRAARGATS
jgi:hypothetical protein